MKSIRGKILLTVLLVSIGSLALLSAMTLFNMNALRNDVVSMSDALGSTAGEDSARAMELQAMEQLTQTAADKAAYADEKMTKPQTYVNMVADYLTQLYSDPGRYVPRAAYAPDPALEGTLSPQLLYFNEGIDPAAVADEVALTANAGDLLLSISRSDGEMECGYFAAASGFSLTVDDASGHKADYLDCPTRQWYQAAMEEDGLIWTDVFDDAMGRGLAITCAMPYRDGTGEIRGVAAFGSTINVLSEEILQTTIGETGYLFVVNQECQTIISPNIRRGEDGAIIRESLLDSGDPQLQALARRILARESGVSLVEFEGRQVYMAYQPMSVLPWSVVAVMDVAEVMAPAQASRDNIGSLTDATVDSINAAIQQVVLMILVVCAVAVAVVVVTAYVLANRLTQPLRRLTEGVGLISGGDLDTQIPVRTRDEIGILAGAFNQMTSSLKRYITDLTSITAEKERIGAELGVATHIQSSMLPCIFPAFPEREEFEIYASMDPAKEVGGDFYDFFMVDDRHLAVVVADVSGKGVPAALFMVIGKTLIKDHTQPGVDLGQVFSQVNDLLCESNSEGLFITAFEGVLDLVTGEFVFVNAGHEMPFLALNGEPFAPHKIRPGFVLAGMEGMCYKYGSLQMAPGDKLFQYTDGVTEATDANEELYGMERLTEILSKNTGMAPDQLLPAVKADIDAFVGQAPQFDDITMLCLEYRARMKEVPHE